MSPSLHFAMLSPADGRIPRGRQKIIIIELDTPPGHDPFDPFRPWGKQEA